MSRIRNDAKRLVKDLHPSSEFYIPRKAKSPATVSNIVAKVKLLAGLVQDLRVFVEIPEDVDYELGIEPLLSDRAAWL